MKNNLTLLLLFTACTCVFGNPDSWLQKSSLPAQPRIGAVAFTLHGFGYVGTGLDSTGGLLDDFWKYDPMNDSWSQVASFTGTARRNAVAFATDTFAYVGTGYDSNGLTKDFYKYDAQNNNWLQIEDLDSAGAVYPRRDAAAFAAGNRGYVVGGYDGTTFYSKETWEYDENSDTVWNEKTIFPMAGRRWASAFAIGTFGFVGLGFNYSQEYFKDLWMFDSGTGAWTQMADFPGSNRGNAAVFVINGYAFAGIGFDASLQDDFYKYEFSTNTWSPVASFGGNPTSAGSGFSVNGKGYVFGGTDTTGYKNDLWEYTPDNTVQLNETATPGDLKVYPNPAANWFEVTSDRIDFNINYEVRLYDDKGGLILMRALSNGENRVSVKDLPRGIYHYAVHSLKNKPAVTGKLILQ